MPKGKAIRSAKQFRFMHAAKAGHVPGLSPNVAGKLLDETSEKRKSKFAKAFRGRVTGRRDVTGHNDVTGRSIY